MKNICPILIQSNAVHDLCSDSFCNKYGYAKFKDDQKFYFGRVRHRGMADKKKRNFTFWYRCTDSGGVTRDAKLDDVECIFLRDDLKIQQEKKLFKDIVDEQNKAHALSLSLKYQVVRIRNAYEPEPEGNFALVVGLAAPKNIRIIWLLTRPRALQYIENDNRNRRACERDFRAADIGDNELLFTDRYDSVKVSSVDDVISVTPVLGNGVDPTGRGRGRYFCRYVCKYQSAGAGLVVARFRQGWTLRAMAGCDRARRANFGAHEDLEKWIEDLNMWILEMSDCAVCPLPPSQPPAQPTPTPDSPP
jgi:hypothetical protein